MPLDSRFGAVPRARRRPGRVGAGGPHVGRPARIRCPRVARPGGAHGRGARLNRGGATAAAVPDGRRGARSATPPASGSRGLAAGCSASSRLAMRAALAKPTRALSTVSSAPTLRCRNRSSRRPTDARAPRLSRAGPPPAARWRRARRKVGATRGAERVRRPTEATDEPRLYRPRPGRGRLRAQRHPDLDRT